MVFDFNKMPVGETVDLVTEVVAREGIEMDADGEQGVTFVVEAPTASASFWLLLPEGRTYRSFDLLRFPRNQPEQVESIEPMHRLVASTQSMIGFSLLAVQPGYRYECRWVYR
jgi:hypothetical protein